MSAKRTWKKLGLIYVPEGIHSKLKSHAANPLAVQLEGDVYRVFYSGRDAENRSSVGAVDVNIVSRAACDIHEEPVFLYGGVNSFYSHGVSVGSLYQVGDHRYMLFMGWQCREGKHWRGDIGRLILRDDFSLSLDSEHPLMTSDKVFDPISLSYPWVQQDTISGYTMWYGSTLSWDGENGEMIHVINYAKSIDGHHWNRKGLAIPYHFGVAQAFSRPTVIGNRHNGFQMWFSFRGSAESKYRIGYAESSDEINWTLKLDESGIDVSSSGWDSEMIEYPFVFEHDDRIYMFYNGNGFGKTGFGLAVLETN